MIRPDELSGQVYVISAPVPIINNYTESSSFLPARGLFIILVCDFGNFTFSLSGQSIENDTALM